MPLDEPIYVPLSDNCGVLETFFETIRPNANGIRTRRGVRLLVWKPVLEDELSRLTWESMKELEAKR